MADGLLVGARTKRLVWGMGEHVYAMVELPLNARVLEVGAGQNPHPAAHVVVDKFLHDNMHRPGQADFAPVIRAQHIDEHGGKMHVQELPVQVIEADVVDMPFADKEFDFVIARDVLEHVPDVVAAFREVSRVGKAGLVDVPRFASEWLWPQGAIHEHVFEDGPDGSVVARPIRFTSPFGRSMHEVFAHDGRIAEGWNASRHVFSLVRVWQGEIRVTVGAPITDPPHMLWSDIYREMERTNAT